jgi:hypothetical protein
MNRIIVDISPLDIKVVEVPNALFMKTRLPDLHLVAPLLMDRMGTAALDELHYPLQRSVVGWRDQQVQVIWHDHKFVKEVGACLAVPQYALREYLRIFWNLEYRAVLPSLRRNEVRKACNRSMLEASHLSSGAKAPFPHHC